VKPVSPYIHALDGRLRIKVPEVKGAPQKAHHIETQFGALGAIEEVTANPLTGNVLILYDARMTTTEEIVDALRAVGYLAAALPAPAPVGEGSVLWATLVLRATTEFALQKVITALI
jgi:copper chaperone CopZ